MAAATPRRARLAHDERAGQILRVARRLFSERHYSAVSTTDIARAAGVTRGLLHHYFGTKRDLYLEVVRSMVRMPLGLLTELETADRDRTEVFAEAVDRWLEMVSRNRGTWLAALGAQGFGRDPDVEEILERAREQTAEQVLALVFDGDPDDASREQRALIRAYAGFAEAASLEWLQRRRLSREQVRRLLVHGMAALVHDVLPSVEDARAARSRKAA